MRVGFFYCPFVVGASLNLPLFPSGGAEDFAAGHGVMNFRPRWLRLGAEVRRGAHSDGPRTTFATGRTHYCGLGDCGLYFPLELVKLVGADGCRFEDQVFG